MYLEFQKTNYNLNWLMYHAKISNIWRRKKNNSLKSQHWVSPSSFLDLTLVCNWLEMEDIFCAIMRFKLVSHHLTFREGCGRKRRRTNSTKRGSRGFPLPPLSTLAKLILILLGIFFYSTFANPPHPYALLSKLIIFGYSSLVFILYIFLWYG